MEEKAWETSVSDVFKDVNGEIPLGDCEVLKDYYLTSP